MTSRDPLPISMVTSSPSALKYPFSLATMNGADGPSHFQSRVNLTGVCANAGSDRKGPDNAAQTPMAPNMPARRGMAFAQPRRWLRNSDVSLFMIFIAMILPRTSRPGRGADPSCRHSLARCRLPSMRAGSWALPRRCARLSGVEQRLCAFTRLCAVKKQVFAGIWSIDGLGAPLRRAIIRSVDRGDYQFHPGAIAAHDSWSTAAGDRRRRAARTARFVL